MSVTQGPKVYAGMLKRELHEVAEKLGLKGVKKLRKAELIERIQATLKRPKPQGKKGSKPVKKKAAAKDSAAPEQEKGPKAAQDTKKIAPQKAASQKKPPAKKAAASPRPEEQATLSDQFQVTAVKYQVGLPYGEEELRHVDEQLPGLPDGYGEDRLVLLPRDPAWMFAYWDVRAETKEQARAHGGQHLALRLYESENGGIEPMAEHWCQEMSRNWYLQVPAPGRTYLVELGYRKENGQWLTMLQSNQVTVPPAGPSSLIADQFLTLAPSDPLPKPKKGRGKAPALAKMGPAKGKPREGKEVAGQAHEAAYHASVGGNAPHEGGSFAGIPTSPGSVTAAPPWSAPQGAEGKSKEGDGFWLVADAEVVVFGATEPDATVKVGDRPVRLRPDGSFSVRVAMPDGELHVPIRATSKDGRHSRQIVMHFARKTDASGS